MQNKLFVRNLAWETTDADLNTLFSRHGSVTSAKIATDRDTGRARGFGFVEMSSQQEAEQAIEGLNNAEVNGRQMFVAFSESQRDKKPQSAYGNRSW